MDIKTDDIIQKYFEQKNILVNHQIESYNYYVDEIIPKIINQYFPVLINFNDSSYTIQNIKLSINKLQVGKPLMVENNGCSKLHFVQIITDILMMFTTIPDFDH